MKAIVAVLALVALILGISSMRLKRYASDLENRLQASGKTLDELRKTVADLQAERDELRKEQGLPEAPSPPRPPRVEENSADATQVETVRRELQVQIEERETRLAEAIRTRDELDSKVKELQAKVDAAVEEASQWKQAEQQFREQVQAAEARNASFEKAADAAARRVEKLEAANRDLRKQADEAERRVASLSRASAMAEDIHRRRESYLNNLQRRYREVTDLYRNLTVRSEAPSSDVSRIQNAISLAEEDLRQLQTLDAEAARLQKSGSNK